MSHVANKHGFIHSNLWYKFDVESIKYSNEHTMRYSDDSGSNTTEKEDGEHFNLSSDEEDNDFMLKDIFQGTLNKQQMIYLGPTNDIFYIFCIQTPNLYK